MKNIQKFGIRMVVHYLNGDTEVGKTDVTYYYNEGYPYSGWDFNEKRKYEGKYYTFFYSNYTGCANGNGHQAGSFTVTGHAKLELWYRNPGGSALFSEKYSIRMIVHYIKNGIHQPCYVEENALCTDVTFFCDKGAPYHHNFGPCRYPGDKNKYVWVATKTTGCFTYDKYEIASESVICNSVIELWYVCDDMFDLAEESVRKDILNPTEGIRIPLVSLEHKTYLPTEECVRMLGRTHLLENTLWLAHSATGIEFYAVGSNLAIKFLADSRLKEKSEIWTRIAIYVNGMRVVDTILDEETKRIPVPLQECKECNIIRVVKLSEAACSTCGIVQIEIDGEIRPTEPKERFIEIIGDSVTCGYGIDDEITKSGFSTAVEDITKTYAYKTAKALHADCSIVALSGYGVISGYSRNGVKSPDRVIPKIYKKFGFCNAVYMGEYLAQNVEWDFTKRRPDLVVLNVGGIDSSYTRGDEEKTEEFVQGYAEFLKTIRACNADAVILCTLGMLKDEMYPAIQRAVEQYRSETADDKISLMKFDRQRAADGMVAGWHPTERTNVRAAKKLIEEIQKIMGW